MQKSLMAVLIASAFFSQGAHAADLIQVYQQALAHDATIASARDALAAGQERVPQAKASILPQIGLGGEIDRTSGEFKPDGLPSGGSQTSHSNTYALTLKQTLFNWGSWQTYQQGKLQQAASEAAYGQAQQDLITRTAQAYFDVLGAQDSLASTQAEKAATTEQLASAKRNFEVGTQTITDTHEAQAAYDLVVAAELASLNDLENKRSVLQSIIGATPSALALLKPGVTILPPAPATIDPWVASAEQQNYGVVGAQLQLELSKREIEKSRSGHYPSVDFNAKASRGTSSATPGVPAGTTTGNSIGVSWSVPLFSGFAVTSRVRESIALEDKARNDLEAARRSAAQSARVSFRGVSSGLAQVKALEAAEVSGQSALDSTKLGYQVGVRINVDVLNAQRSLYATRTNLAKARYDAIMSGLRLKAAAGTLKEADLEPVNGLLQK